MSSSIPLNVSYCLIQPISTFYIPPSAPQKLRELRTFSSSFPGVLLLAKRFRIERELIFWGFVI